MARARECSYMTSTLYKRGFCICSGYLSRCDYTAMCMSRLCVYHKHCAWVSPDADVMNHDLGVVRWSGASYPVRNNSEPLKAMLLGEATKE